MSTCPFHYSEYRSIDDALIARFIDIFPLALITRHSAEGIIASHIPLFRRADNTLFSHADRNNPLFSDGVAFEAHIVFMGPSSYIPPEAYISKQLPTWNYVAVHMAAQIEPITNIEENFAILQQTSRYLSREAGDFIAERNDPRVESRLQSIHGIQVTPKHVEGRFKLSQETSPEDRETALSWLINQPHAEKEEFLRSLLYI